MPLIEPMLPSVEGIVTILDGVSLDQVEASDVARKKIIASAERMLARLKTPHEQLLHICLANPMIELVLRVLVDIGIFEGWAEKGGKEATLRDLWEMCKVPNIDIELLRRLLRMVVATNLVREVGEARYMATPTSRALADSKGIAVQGLVKASPIWWTPMISAMPSFLKKLDYENPDDPNNTVFMESSGGRKMFDIIAHDPGFAQIFQATMDAILDMKFHWTHIYDTRELLKGFEFDDTKENILLVDVGGGKGTDINRLLKKHPEIPSDRIVLQELPAVIAAAKATASVDAGVVCQSHDFFKEQPVVGARAYFLHAVLHDWEDIEARRILRQIHASMKKGYSKLLVCDTAMPPTGANFYQAFADISILCAVSAQHRTEERWVRLLRSANFEVVKIWRHEAAMDCVMEAKLAEPYTVVL